MELVTDVFRHGQAIPQKHTCDGENVNPSFRFIDVPPETQSLVLIMDDPDAPGGTFVHWIVGKIDAQVTLIEEDSLPSGAELGMNGYGVGDYKGPCPPAGAPHRYSFRLYALDVYLDMNQLAPKSEVVMAMEGHVIAEAELIGTYGRA